MAEYSADHRTWPNPNVLLFFCRYGHPGVEFYGQHESECNVRKILFLLGQGRLVTLTEDNHLHLWEINGTLLQVS